MAASVPYGVVQVRWAYGSTHIVLVRETPALSLSELKTAVESSNMHTGVLGGTDECIVSWRLVILDGLEDWRGLLRQIYGTKILDDFGPYVLTDEAADALDYEHATAPAEISRDRVYKIFGELEGCEHVGGEDVEPEALFMRASKK